MRVAAVTPPTLWGAVCLLCIAFMGCQSGDSTEVADGSAKASSDTQVAESAKDASATSGAQTTSEGSDAKKKKKKRRERTTSVRASAAFRGDLVMSVIAEGTIRARHSTELRTETSGRLMRIHGEEGQRVRKNQLLAKLDDREYTLAFEEARVKYLQALSVVAIEEETISVPKRPPHIQEQIDELVELDRNHSITHEERVAREIALDVQAIKDGHFRLDVLSARSGIAERRAALERARLQLERTEIRAPFSGIITGLEVSEGEQVTLNQTLCVLVNNLDLEAEVGVLEADIGDVSTGSAALLVVPALGDTLHAHVDVISPQFDRESRTCQVLLRLANKDGRVRPGMFARAIIAGATYPEQLLVPKAAILTRDGRPLLFKVEDKRAKWLYLKLGRQNETLVAIERVLQGGSLAADDLVVVTDHLTLAHDTKVKVKKVLPIHDPWALRE